MQGNPPPPGDPQQNPYLPGSYTPPPEQQQPYYQQPYGPQPYGHAPPPAPSGFSPKLRLWICLFGLAGFMWAFESGRDVIRPKDSAPRKVTAAEAARLPEGSWVEITGGLNVDTVREIKGPFRSTGVFLVQFEGDGPSPVVATNKERTPAFAELASKGWLADKKKKHDPPSTDEETEAPIPPAVLALFSTPQTFTGVLYKPGGQSMAKSDQIEIDDQKIKVAGYCGEPEIRCTSDKLVLVTGAKPNSRAGGIAQAMLGLIAGVFLLGLGLFGGRKRAA